MEKLVYYKWDMTIFEFFSMSKDILKVFDLPDDKGHNSALKEMLKQQYKIEKEAEHYHNDIYDVRVYKHLWQMPYAENKAYTDLIGDDMVWLSIKRKDKEPCKDWRDFMDIKNQLVGEEHEAVELYPAKQRVVDTANQFHLWCFKNPKRFFPFGFTNGCQMDKEAETRFGNSKQRKFEV